MSTQRVTALSLVGAATVRVLARGRGGSPCLGVAGAMVVDMRFS